MPSTVLCTVFSLHHSIFTTSLWDFTEETTAYRGICFSWLTNSYQSIKAELKSHFLQEVSLPFPLHLLHPPFTFSLIIMEPVFFFLIDTLGDTVTHQFCFIALSLCVCWVSGCGCNTLKVGGVLSFAPNIGQNVGRVCTYKIWSRTRHLLNCNELDFCPLPRFRFHIMFPQK